MFIDSLWARCHMGAEKGLSPHPQLTVMDEHTVRSLNAAQKTHALRPIKRFIFFFMLRNSNVVLPPKGSHPEGMGGREE